MRGEQAEHMCNGMGFVAALDQSGGSTPKALQRYGIAQDAYHDQDEMFKLVHAMRERIVASQAFSSERILAAILFEKTMDGAFDGVPAADYLWERKHIVPFLKVDKGLQAEADGVQLMKPIPGLGELLERALAKHIFGTKMRSVIKSANPDGIRAVVDQQFEIGRQIAATGLIPILDPEIDIAATDKAECERLLLDELGRHLAVDAFDAQIMFKLTIPEVDGLYTPFIEHPAVLRVVALSGGYSREEANSRLARNPGLIASFSRALTEGLHLTQPPDEFDAALDAAVRSIYEASIT